MHAGKVLASGTRRSWLKNAEPPVWKRHLSPIAGGGRAEQRSRSAARGTRRTHAPRQGFSLRRLFSYSRREHWNCDAIRYVRRWR